MVLLVHVRVVAAEHKQSRGAEIVSTRRRLDFQDTSSQKISLFAALAFARCGRPHGVTHRRRGWSASSVG
ncbi:hypothetical protein FMEAI12_2440007 [Parafrankia sp. Ea1.12]|nr:hypothetical protein FMEAI12_2440007 [Parafrankia sp. Ea1.12]